MKKTYASVFDMVGKTPMFEFGALKNKLQLKANVFGKCEFYNPLFSIKDRAAVAMIKKMMQEIDDKGEAIVVEATSGNVGVALSAFCASQGVKLVIVMPEDTPAEKVKLVKYYGSDVILTPKEDGMKGAIAKAEMLAQKSKNVKMLRQFENQENINAHLFGTSMEILNDMGGDVDVLVASVGTSATLMGIAQSLKTSNPDLYVVAVEPKKSNVLNGGVAGKHNIPGIGAGFIPPFYKKELVDEVFDVSDDDAWDMAKVVAQNEGLPIGVSAGAAMTAAVNLAMREKFKDKNIVVVLPDAINNYVSVL